jgi:trk system potassium uptake protein TrkH
MRPRLILTVLGFLLFAVGCAMMTAYPVALHFGGRDASPLLFSSILTIVVGLSFWRGFRSQEENELRVREGFAIVTLGWVIVPLFGSLPFLLSGAIPSFTDAYFETISGFTTTGASILRDVEVLSHGLLYWRSLTHWIGGMGIIVLSLAVLPLLGIGGMQLFKAEVAGPTKDKITPRVAETARLLWGVYVLFTVTQIVLLMAGEMPLFDAVCHSFATISTGGFSTKNASIGYYNSVYIDCVVMLFMFIGGTNFSLHLAALKGSIGSYLRDAEFNFFLVSFVIATVLITLFIAEDSFGGELGTALRFAAFNTMSVMSCTGFATADFALWAPLAQIVLFFLMFPGACAGSTGGGLKNLRVLILLRTAMNELKKIAHPKVVVNVRVGDKTIDQDILFTIAGFIILYLVTFSTSSIILTATGLDIVTAMSSVASALANIGPGLGTVGPVSNFAHLTDLAKWVLSACMLLGRLEIYTVLVLFSSAFWKK